MCQAYTAFLYGIAYNISYSQFLIIIIHVTCKVSKKKDVVFNIPCSRNIPYCNSSLLLLVCGSVMVSSYLEKVKTIKTSLFYVNTTTVDTGLWASFTFKHLLMNKHPYLCCSLHLQIRTIANFFWMSYSKLFLTYQSRTGLDYITYSQFWLSLEWQEHVARVITIKGAWFQLLSLIGTNALLGTHSSAIALISHRCLKTGVYIPTV